MKTAIVTATLESISPYCQSGYISEPKKDRENPRDFEERTWKHRIHANEKGFVFIPATAFHKSIARAAEMLSQKIPGQRNATYTKHFSSGVLVAEAMTLDVKAEDVEAQRLLLNADGKRGGGTRVERIIPTIRKWSGTVQFMLLDPVITEKVFNEHLEAAGLLVGVGQHRPENRGFCGRFIVKDTKFKGN